MLTDALAVGTAYATIDPKLSAARLNEILRAASASNTATLERTLDALCQSVGLGGVTATNNRDALYNRIDDLPRNAVYLALVG